MNRSVIGKCSICGGRVSCPTGPIGYAGPLENLIRCDSCGARKADDLQVVKMSPPVQADDESVARYIEERTRSDAEFARLFEAERLRLDALAMSPGRKRRRPISFN